MTSESRESSWSDGKPVSFVRFTRRTVSWFYTSSDREETHNGDVYFPAPISRDAIRQGSERTKLNLKITLPSTLDVAENWRPYPSVDPIGVTWFTRHVGETDIIVDWVGRVTAPKFMGATLDLVCSPSSSTARRLGTQRCWQRGCGVALYTQGLGMCNVDPADHVEECTLTATAGSTLTATEFGSFPDGRLHGGFIEWDRVDGLVEYRSIMSHSSNIIATDYGAADLAPGLVVRAYPGCAHTWSDCAYFDNQDNYAGDLWIPQSNPYSGNQI